MAQVLESELSWNLGSEDLSVSMRKWFIHLLNGTKSIFFSGLYVHILSLQGVMLSPITRSRGPGVEPGRAWASRFVTRGRALALWPPVSPERLRASDSR